MREAAAGAEAPEVRGAGDRHPSGNEAQVGTIRPPSATALAALAASADEGAWITALLDGLESQGLRRVYVQLERDGQLALAGARGVPPALEQELRGGSPASAAKNLSLEPGAQIGVLDDHPAPEELDLLLEVAGGALRRLRADAGDDLLWKALRAIEVEGGGAELLEAIVTQASRLAGTGHVEVRWQTVTGAEWRCCTVAGARLDGTAHACCSAAASLAQRIPLRAGQLQLGELVVGGGGLPCYEPSSPRRLRRFVAVVAARLELERLRQEVSLLAREESRARFREERFELALARAPVALATQDRDLRYTWVHRPRWLRGEEMLGRTDLEIFGGGDGMRLHLLKQQVLHSGTAAHAEVTVPLGGKLCTFQLVVEPLRDPWQAVSGVAVAAIDVTARVQEAGAREELLLQREDERSWLLAVIDRSPVGILLVETDGGEERITANRRAAELLGHPVDPVLARRVVAGRLFAPDGSPLPMDQLPSSRALRGERVSMEEALLRRLDGRQVPIVISAGPIVDGSGQPAGAVVTFDDISPFKELERMREQWTSLITHDLRQPITSISGFAGVLAEHPDLPAHLRPKVVHIVAAAKRLGRMTADLLEASRLESHQLALERQPTDLAALVREVVERLSAELQDHPVRIVRGEQLPLLEIDPERFEQVLGNLLSNAGKYSPPGSEILVEIDRREGEAVVGVTNEGGSLPVEELGAIFHRFHRTDRARRSRIRGLGLGLYIARGLVEAHGGRIWAETDPGRSVTFRFAFPIGGW